MILIWLEFKMIVQGRQGKLWKLIRHVYPAELTSQETCKMKLTQFWRHFKSFLL